MILADKIIDLRKKNGWSQEELAEKLDVSRQAVSKWESAQSVPDMNRVLLMSEVFGVTTDYLLKDELGAESVPASPLPEDAGRDLRRVSMEDAQAFIRHRKQSAAKISLGVLMCILSPIALVLLSVGQDSGVVRLSEQQAAGLGLLPLFLLVGGAVALFVLAGLSGRPYEYLDKECFETEYGVSGYVREQQEKDRPSFVTRLVLGVVLCVMSAVPIFVAMLWPENKEFGDFRYAVAVAALLALVALGVYLIVNAGVAFGAYSVLLEEGDHSRETKEAQRRIQTVASIYWGVVTAGYLAYSFITMDWARSWIVWPVAGVLYGVIAAVYTAVGKKN